MRESIYICINWDHGGREGGGGRGREREREVQIHCGRTYSTACTNIQRDTDAYKGC